MEETSHRRPRLLYIGIISVVILILVGPSIFMMVLWQPVVIFSSPGESLTIGNGEWFAKSFTIDDDIMHYGVGVDGVLFNHNINVDNIYLEFGYAPLSLTSFMSLNDTEKMDSFWGYGGGGGWDQSGMGYSSGHFGVNGIGEYVWAIRFIDLDNNSTVFETNFEISLIVM